MSRIGMACGLMWAVLVMAGCMVAAPPYPKEMLTFDEGLIGRWGTDPVAGAHAAELLMTIERQDQDLLDGTLAGKVPFAGPDPAGRTPAYRVDFVNREEGGRERHQRFDAVMLDISGVTMMAMQIAMDEECVREKFPYILPVHMVFKIKRDGDAIRAWAMRAQVVWMPVRVLGQREGELQLPKEDGMWLVSDPQQFFAVLKKAAACEACWTASEVGAVRMRPGA